MQRWVSSAPYSNPIPSVFPPQFPFSLMLYIIKEWQKPKNNISNELAFSQGFLCCIMFKGHLILNTSWILHHNQKVAKRSLWVFLLEVLAMKEWAMWDGKNCCCFCFCRWTEHTDATGAIRAKKNHTCAVQWNGSISLRSYV